MWTHLYSKNQDLIVDWVFTARVNEFKFVKVEELVSLLLLSEGHADTGVGVSFFCIPLVKY